MAVAELELRKPDTERSLIMELEEQYRERGYIGSREIAEAVFADRGRQLFLELEEQCLIEMLDRLFKNRGNSSSPRRGITGKRMTVEGERGAVPVIRVAAVGKAYWSSAWNVNGVAKETRDLTKSDLRFLIKHYYEMAGEMRARALWLVEVLRVASNKRVERLGELEAKGIDLPTIDVEIEN